MPPALVTLFTRLPVVAGLIIPLPPREPERVGDHDERQRRRVSATREGGGR